MILDAVRRVVLPKPLQHQISILLHPARFKVVCCGRRFGKTLLGLIAVLTGHGPRGKRWKGALDGGNVWWVAPTDKVARKIWRDLKRSLRHWPDLVKREDERRIEFPGGGSVEVRSAHDPDSLRGDGLDGVVIDEAAFCDETTWEILQPALADKLGWAIFISTPRGQNWFFDEFNAALPAEENSVESARWHRPSSDNPRLSRDELARMRRKMGELKYARECLAEFTAGGTGTFKRQHFRFYEWVDDETISIGSTLYRLADMHRFGTADLASTVKTRSDFSVLASWGITNDNRFLVLLDVVRKKMDAPEILKEIERVLDEQNLVEMRVEFYAATSAIVSLAQEKKLPVREVVVAKDKIQRAQPAAAAIEAGRTWFPKRARWLDAFTAELVGFDPPRARDDQVDCLSAAQAVVRERRRNGGGLGAWKAPDLGKLNF